MRFLLGTEDKTLWPQDYIEGIRKAYEEDWYASKVRERQMAVALYFIDKLALRAGHEKDEDEADTVGCCTLKASACFTVQHTHLHECRVVCQPLRVADPQVPLPQCILTSGMGLFPAACRLSFTVLVSSLYIMVQTSGLCTPPGPLLTLPVASGGECGLHG